MFTNSRSLLRKCTVGVARLIGFVVFAVYVNALCAATSAPAPDAGTSLSTRAEAAYAVGSLTALKRYSNTVTVRVLPVESLTFGANQPAFEVVPGATVHIPLVLRNTGNNESAYRFSLPAEMRRGASLYRLALHHDVNGNGVADPEDPVLSVDGIASPGGTTLALKPRRRAALVLIATLPDAATSAVPLTLTASTSEQHIGKSVTITLRPAKGAAVRVRKWFAEPIVDPGEKARFWIKANNEGTRPAGAASHIDGHEVRIDGRARPVFLLRDVLPRGGEYVPGSLKLSAPAGAFTVFRNASDAPYDYRTTEPADPGKIVEIGVALPASGGLPVGADLSVSLQLAVDRKFADDHLLNVSDAYFALDASAVQTPAVVHSNQASVAVGVPKATDFISAIRYAGDHFAGGRGQIIATASNQGRRTSSAPITLAITVPTGLSVEKIHGEGWRCTDPASTGTIHCTSTQSLAQNAVSTPVTIDTVVSDDILLPGQTGTRLTIRARVDGQDEPKELSYNNISVNVVEIMSGATVSGRAWIDQDMDGRFDGGAIPLKGWRAQLLQGPVLAAPAIAGSGAGAFDWRSAPVVKEASTDEQGRYAISNVRPGYVYALRFVTPSGRWLGVPMNGSPQDDQSIIERDFQHGLLIYQQLAVDTQYREQNLPIVPSGIIYDAVKREPVAGVAVQLKAQTSGFDPTRHLIGGANNATIKTDDNGFYYFRLSADAPAGEYRFEVQEAPGYRAGTSLLLPPEQSPLRLSSTGYVPVASQLSVPGTDEEARYYTGFIRSVSAAQPALTAFAVQDIDDGPARMVNNHLPIDPVNTSANALVLTKEADRPTVEIIDFVNYTMTLSHTLPVSLNGFQIADALPAGFNYIPGSARLLIGGAAQPIGDPPVGAGQLQFNFPTAVLPSGAQAVITYRARVGATVQEGTQAISRAQAQSAPYTSNEATATVRVVGGVFSTDAFVAGKVFLDCDGDGMQGADEPGVPGVRVYLEDGTYAQTDIDGKYSLYGLKPLTHVLKLDPMTFPAGARALPIDQRNAGRGDSRFLDLRNGELGRGDFALSCADDVLQAVQARRDRLLASKLPDEMSAAVSQRMDATYAERTLGDIKSRPAAGMIDAKGDVASTAIPTGLPLGNPSGAPDEASSRADSVNARPAPSAGFARDSTRALAATASDAPMSLEKLLPRQDASLDFIGLKDGDIVPENMPPIQVKGPDDAHFSLEVNGRIVPEKQVGKRSVLKEKHVAAWEYVGVALQAGENVLVLRAASPQGETREKRIRVILPGPLATLKLLVADNPVADGSTPTQVDIRAEDEHGIPTGGRIPLTLAASAGAWQIKDLDERAPGVQTFMDGGVARVVLTPPTQSGPVVLTAQSGSLRVEQTVNFVPALRPMMATGILEGIISLRNGLIETGGARNNGFERELKNLSRSWGDGHDSAGARAAFFLKGQVKGEYLLTAAFDSEKDVKDRLFRDIQPDKYYPIYGDSSLRGFDAQSTSRLYLRVDKGATYLLYGDFSTASRTELRQLTQYNRSVTGLSHHYQGERVSANVFASRDNLVQRVAEIPANGTSGPFMIFGADYVENSEQVEIITRDRSQSGLIIKTQTLSRFADYDIDLLSGQLRLRGPVPSVDPDTGNPNFIRITFESDGSGPKFWVVGGDAQVKVTDSLSLGVVAVEDRNPANARQLHGVTVAAKLGPQTTATGEYALTRTDESGHGNGVRAELRHETGNLKAKVNAIRTDDGFDNLSAPVRAGHTELRGQADYRLNETYTLKGELVRTVDRPINTGFSQSLTPLGGATGDWGNALNANQAVEYTGALFSIERALAPGVKGELGTRIVRGTANAQNGMQQDIDLTTILGQITSVVPGLPKASVFASYEQDVRDSAKRALAVGGSYALGAGSRLYGRQEIISSLGSLYDLNGTQRSYRTQLGIDTEYVKDGRIFSEYRQGGAIDGRDAQAAFGVRNGWELRPGLRLSTTFERTRTVGGGQGASNHATAMSGAVEYLASQRWKGSASLELRRSDTEDGVLNTFGIAVKLSPDWSLLGKSAIYRTVGRIAQNVAADSLRMRQRVGLAWRQSRANLVNALAYYEHRLETGHLVIDTTDRRQAHIVSSHVNFKPDRHIVLSGRYAYKSVTENGGALNTRLSAHLFSGRMTWDIGQRWDAGITGSTMFDSASQRRNAIGLEVGYRFKDDLWFSLGHNIVGFYDRDFSDQVQTTQGVYFRLRYKFDENSWS